MALKSFALLFAFGFSAMPAFAVSPAKPGLSPVDRLAAFKAARAVRRGNMWLICADEPNPSGAQIDDVRDLNGDGRPDAVITEGGTFCYGSAEMGYAIVSKQANGSWRLIDGGSGIPNFLPTKAKGWPDMEIGGPGFCFPVHRWNGTGYALHRFQYEGKTCRPNR